MNPLFRVAATTVVAASLAGAAALSASPGSVSTVASQAALQTTTAASLQAADARAQSALAARLAAGRAAQLLAARHRAYLASAARLAAARAREQAAAHAAPQAAAATRSVATTPRTVESYAARGRRIYTSFHYDLGTLGYRIVFKPYAKGLLGLTDSGTHTVTVYVRSTESDLVLAHSIAHEMGHALDFSRGSDARHQAYLSIRQLHSRLIDWFGCNNCTDYSTAAGDWAEVFAQWLAGPGDFRSQMAGAPSKAELAQLTPLFQL